MCVCVACVCVYVCVCGLCERSSTASKLKNTLKSRDPTSSLRKKEEEEYRKSLTSLSVCLFCSYAD